MPAAIRASALSRMANQRIRYATTNTVDNHRAKPAWASDPDAAANRAVSVVIDNTSAGFVDVVGAAGQQQDVTIDLPQTTASGPHQVSIRRQSVESNQVRIGVT